MLISQGLLGEDSGEGNSDGSIEGDEVCDGLCRQQQQSENHNKLHILCSEKNI